MTDVAPETDVEAIRNFALTVPYGRMLLDLCDEIDRLHSLFLRAEEERDEGTSLGFILRENHALRRAASQVLHEYDLWAEDANDGEFAIWSRDEFMASFMRLRAALATPEETKEAERTT